MTPHLRKTTTSLSWSPPYPPYHPPNRTFIFKPKRLLPRLWPNRKRRLLYPWKNWFQKSTTPISIFLIRSPPNHSLNLDHGIIRSRWEQTSNRKSSKSTTFLLSNKGNSTNSSTKIWKKATSFHPNLRWHPLSSSSVRKMEVFDPAKIIDIWTKRQSKTPIHFLISPNLWINFAVLNTSRSSTFDWDTTTFESERDSQCSYIHISFWTAVQETWYIRPDSSPFWTVVQNDIL